MNNSLALLFELGLGYTFAFVIVLVFVESLSDTERLTPEDLNLRD